MLIQLYYILIDIIIFAVLFLIWQRKKSAGQGILLTGLSDTGKTLIYARLICSKFVRTYTSVKENIGDIVVNNVSLVIYIYLVCIGYICYNYIYFYNYTCVRVP